MTLALAVLLAGMTACGNNTTNDTGNGNTNTESDMGQTDNRNDVNTTEMPSNDNVNDVTEGTDGNANGTNGTNTGDRNTLGDDVGDAAEDVTRGVGEGVEGCRPRGGRCGKRRRQMRRRIRRKTEQLHRMERGWHSKYALLLLPYLKNFPWRTIYAGSPEVFLLPGTSAPGLIRQF